MMGIRFDGGRFEDVWGRVTAIDPLPGEAGLYQSGRQAEAIRDLAERKGQCAALAVRLGQQIKSGRDRQTLFAIGERARRHASRLSARLFILTGETGRVSDVKEQRSGLLTGLRRLYMWQTECAGLLNELSCGVGDVELASMLREMGDMDAKSAAALRQIIERMVK